MPYHVIVRSGGVFGPSSEVWDVSGESLEERILAPYRQGEPITAGGKTFTPADPPHLEIYEGPTRRELNEADVPVASLGLLAMSSTDLTERTDDFVRGPFGYEASEPVGKVDRAQANDIFVVHGRNLDAASAVARRLEKAVASSHAVVLLGERPDAGQTIIEKLEAAARTVRFAVVLLTADDEGRLVGADEPLSPRARQNVVFELGYFVALLGRTHVAAVVEEGVELPSDFLGVLYVDRSSSDWDVRLARRLREAGLDADLNRLIDA
jgi:predicted nucleotide-binding protein